MGFDKDNPMEYFQNAKTNFETFLKMNPAVRFHPIFMMALEQLINGIAVLEKKE
jgi:hypothetical protein